MHCSTPASTLPGNTPRCWRRKWWMHCSRGELISFRHCQIHQKDCARHTITWSGTKAALPAQPIRQDTVFAFFHDPALVGQCHALGVGAHLQVQLGGRVVPEYGGSIAFDAVVERLTSGDFINDGPMEQGLSCHIGRTVVLRGVQLPLLRVVVTETCQSPNDMAWCRLHGIDLQQVRLLCIK